MSDPEIHDAIDPDEERLIETGAPPSDELEPAEDQAVEVGAEGAAPVPEDDRPVDPGETVDDEPPAEPYADA